MTDYTIVNEYTLPSEGAVYEQEVKSQFKLRSMTTAEEMKRLNHSDRQYKIMSEVIDDCMIDDIGISAYDLCVSDYQFVLHKLRVVTYGPLYKLESKCPYCGVTNQDTINLDDIPVIPFTSTMFEKYSKFKLPVTGKEIKLRMQTPRALDTIAVKIKEEKRGTSSENLEMLFTLMSLIDTVDGEKVEEFKLIPFLKQLPMMDTNYILRASQKLVNSFGLDTQLHNTCNICGLDYNSNFRTTSEFFGPSID